MDPPTDGTLLVLISDSDRGAFETLYHRYARTVFGLALRRLGDRDRAEEAVQETFTAVWRSAYPARPGAGRTGLYAVARNIGFDRFRGRGEPVAEVPDAASPDAGPDEAAEADWVAWRVHRALKKPPNERQVVELAYWSGLTQSEWHVPRHPSSER